MGSVVEIRNEIESLVEGGDVEKGEIIRVSNLDRELMILVTACFAGNTMYETEKEANIDAQNSGQETYTLYLKYLGGRNA